MTKVYSNILLMKSSLYQQTVSLAPFCPFSFRSVQQREKTENSLDKKKLLTKGHLNSERIYEGIDFQKQEQEYCKDFWPESFFID